MNNRPALKTQLDAVIHFITKMDADMVSTLLNDKYTFQDYSKSLFIRKLGDLFWEFRQLGDFQLIKERGECYGCSCGVKGYTFIGNKSRSYIDIVFVESEESEIMDIYECGEFFNKESHFKKRNRLYLDKYVDFEFEDEDDDYYEDGDDFYRDGDDDMPF